MRRSQGLPVNMIVMIALLLLAIVVVSIFFFTGFGQSSSSMKSVDKTQAECQGICQGLILSAMIYDDCADLYGYAPGACSCNAGCTPIPPATTCSNPVCVPSGAASCSSSGEYSGGCNCAKSGGSGTTTCTPTSACANKPLDEYLANCNDYGTCTVNIKGGKQCECGPTSCILVTD